MKRSLSLRLLALGIVAISFSVSSANAQGALSPKKEVKKEISVKGLLPILELLFPKSVSVKDTTITNGEQDPISKTEEKGLESDRIRRELMHLRSGPITS